jgi:hypothetical protein
MIDPIPIVDTGLANSALGKVASGKALTELSKQEQDAIGKLSPQALAYARAQFTAPGLKSQYSSPGPGAPQPVGLANQYSSPGPDKPPAYGASQQYAEGGVPPSPAPSTTPSVYGTSRGYAEGATPPIPRPNPYPGNSAEQPPQVPGGQNVYNGSVMVDPPKLNIPTPPPVLPAKATTAPTPAATTPEMAGQADRVNADKNTPWTSSIPTIPKDMNKAKLMDLLSNIMDAVGGGMRAYGGTNAPTRLMRQGELNMQVAASKQQAQNQANIELNQRLALLDPETQAIIQRDQAAQAAVGNTQVDVATRLQSINIALARAGKAPIFLDPETLARNAVATKAGK